MKLYVGNLPWSIDDNGLKELFADYDVDDANVIKNKFNNRSKGFGFVTINDEASAKKAMAEMHEKEIDGRKLTVNEARPMVSRDNSRGFHKPRGSGRAPFADSDEVNESVEDSMDDEE